MQPRKPPKFAVSMLMLFLYGAGFGPLAYGYDCEEIFMKERPVELPRQNHFNVGLVAFGVSPQEGPLTWNAFLTRTENHIRKAVSQGAELVVFPELTLLSVTAEGPALAELARTKSAEYFQFHVRLAKELHTAVLTGSFPRELRPGHIVNSAALVFADGKVVYQDKLNLTPDEVTWGWKAGDALQMIDAPWGRTAILICYDSQFPGLSESLVKFRPDVLLIPSMTGSNGFERVNVSAAARAIEHHAFVLTTGVVGRDPKDTEYVGQASIYTPRDEGFPGVLASTTKQSEQVLVANLNLLQLRQSQASSGIFAARAERERDKPYTINIASP